MQNTRIVSGESGGVCFWVECSLFKKCVSYGVVVVVVVVDDVGGGGGGVLESRETPVKRTRAAEMRGARV